MFKSKPRLSYASRFKSSSLLTLNEIDAFEKSIDWRKNYNVKPKEIGRGHFSKVYLVTSLSDEKTFAAKVIRRRKGGIDRLDKIRKEAEIIKRLNEKNVTSVIHLYETFESFSEIVLICELAKGGSLFSLIQESTTGLNENYVKCVIYKLLQTLEFMHSENIVHLDIKADNILLREPFPSANIALCDFGLATELKKEKSHKELVGTPDYMAPEVVNYEKITVNTDMWSVGVLTYYLLTGNSPFMGASKDETLINVSKVRIVFDPIFEQNQYSRSKDFISSLCVKSSKLRLSSSDAQTHMWFENLLDLHLDYSLESPRCSPVNNFDNDSYFDRNLNNYRSLPLKSSRRSNSFDFESLVSNFPNKEIEKSFPTESSDNIFIEDVQNPETDNVYSNNNNSHIQGRVMSKLLSNVDEVPDELQYDTQRSETLENSYPNLVTSDNSNRSEYGNDKESCSKHCDYRNDNLLNDYYDVEMHGNLIKQLPLKVCDEESYVNISEMTTGVGIQSVNLCFEDPSLEKARNCKVIKESNGVKSKSGPLIDEPSNLKSNQKLSEDYSRNFINLTEKSANIKDESNIHVLRAEEIFPKNERTNVIVNSSDPCVELNCSEHLIGRSGSFKCDLDGLELNRNLHEIQLMDKILLSTNFDENSGNLDLEFQEMFTQNKEVVDKSEYPIRSMGQSELGYDNQNFITPMEDLDHTEFDKHVNENTILLKSSFPNSGMQLLQGIEIVNDLESSIHSEISNPFTGKVPDSIYSVEWGKPVQNDLNANNKNLEGIQKIPEIIKLPTDDEESSETFKESVAKLSNETELIDSETFIGERLNSTDHIWCESPLESTDKSMWFNNFNLTDNNGDFRPRKDSFNIDDLSNGQTDGKSPNGGLVNTIDQPHSVYTVIELENTELKVELANIDCKSDLSDLNHTSGVDAHIANGNQDSSVDLNSKNDITPKMENSNYVDNLPHVFHREELSIINTSGNTLFVNTYQSVEKTASSPNNLKLDLSTLKGIQSISKPLMPSNSIFSFNINYPIVSHFRGKTSPNYFSKSPYREKDSLDSLSDNDLYSFGRNRICKSESDDSFLECNLPVNLDEYDNISNTGLDRIASGPALPRTSSTTSSGTQRSTSDGDFDDKDNLRYTAFIDHLCILL